MRIVTNIGMVALTLYLLNYIFIKIYVAKQKVADSKKIAKNVSGSVEQVNTFRRIIGGGYKEETPTLDVWMDSI